MAATFSHCLFLFKDDEKFPHEEETININPKYKVELHFKKKAKYLKLKHVDKGEIVLTDIGKWKKNIVDGEKKWGN